MTEKPGLKYKCCCLLIPKLTNLLQETSHNSRHSPCVVVVAKEIDGLAVLQGDGTQTSPGPEFLPAIGIEEKLKEGKCGALVADVVLVVLPVG